MQVTTTQQTTPSSPTPTGTGANKLSADFNAFIKMLTAQVKNQDPLKPIDSTELLLNLQPSHPLSSRFSQILSCRKLVQILGAVTCLRLQTLSGNGPC